jgi:hypothetical protein
MCYWHHFIGISVQQEKLYQTMVTTGIVMSAEVMKMALI